MIQSRHVISNWGILFANVIIAFFLSPFVVHRLGDVAYGIWILINSLTGYVGILNFGLHPTINKYVSHYNATSERQTLNDMLSSTRLIFTISGGISLLVTIGIIVFIPSIVKGIGNNLNEVRLAIFLIGLQIAGSFLFTMYESILVGMQRFEVSNAVLFVSLVLRSAMIFVFLYIGYGIVAVAGATLVSYAVEWGLMRHYSYRILDTLHISFRRIRKDLIIKALGFSTYVFIIIVASRISFQTDSLVIGYYMSAGWITYFAIAATLVNYGRQMQGGIYGVIFPKSSALHATGDTEALRQLLVDGTRYTLMMQAPIFIGLFFFGSDFIRLWMGEKYCTISGNILMILAIGHLARQSQSISDNICINTGYQRHLAKISVAEAIINIVLSVILVRSMGIYGVAWGTSIPIILSPIIVSMIATKSVGIGYRDYLRRTYLSILPAVFVFSITVLGMQQLWPITSWGRLAISVLASLTIYGLVLKHTYLNEEEKNQIQNIFISLLNRKVTDHKI